MAESNSILNIVLQLKDQASSQIDGFTGKLKDMQPQFKAMAATGVAGFTAIAAGAYSMIDAFAESEAQLTQADTIMSTFSKETMKQFGGNMDLAKQVAREFGAEMQAVGGIADEEFTIAFAKMTQITGDSSMAMEAAAVAADLAKFKSIDYASAADLVGKVLAGNTAILGRYGIEIKEGATAQEALGAIAERTKGQYEAFGQTVAGQTAIMSQSIGDLKENIGAALAPVMAIIVEKLKPMVQGMIDWSAAHPELIRNIVAAGLAATSLLATVGLLGLAIPALASGFAVLGSAGGLIGIGIAAVATVIVFFRDRIAELLDVIAERTGLVQLFQFAWESVSTTFTATLLPALMKLWESLKPLMPFFEALAKLVGVAFVASIYVMVGALMVAVNTFTFLLTKAVELETFIIKNLTGAFEAVRGVIESVISTVMKLIDAIGQLNVVSKVQNMASGIGSSIGGFVSKISPFADGGIVTRPTIGLVGEAGTEAIIPLSKMGSLGGGGGITVNVYGDVTGDELIEKVRAGLMSELRLDTKFSV